MHASALFGSLIGALEPQTTAVKESSSGKYDIGVAILSIAVSSILS